MDIKSLFGWFEREGVSYPWGNDKSPYRVWISEVMLQQTVVTAVIPFFTRWIERFPTLEELARTEEGEVLRYWEGLGYYSRARNILKTARIVAEEYKGVFPCEYDALTGLPGIGDYTASAVMSISFGEPRPVIDANVKRICQRLGAHPLWDRERERYWRKELSHLIGRSGDPGRFNGALMQLGQLVCRTGSPLCGACPLSGHCSAFREGVTAQIPLRRKREVIELSSQLRIFCKADGTRMSYWIIQRREGIGRGLWTFPRFESDRSLPEDWKEVRRLKERKHTYTKYRETLIPLVLVYRGKDKAENSLPAAAWREGEGFWATAGELENLAAPAVYRKIINELTAAGA